jgi:hypothetical protein
MDTTVILVLLPVFLPFEQLNNKSIVEEVDWPPLDLNKTQAAVAFGDVHFASIYHTKRLRFLHLNGKAPAQFRQNSALSVTGRAIDDIAPRSLLGGRKGSQAPAHRHAHQIRPALAHFHVTIVINGKLIWVNIAKRLQLHSSTRFRHTRRTENSSAAWTTGRALFHAPHFVLEIAHLGGQQIHCFKRDRQ